MLSPDRAGADQLSGRAHLPSQYPSAHRGHPDHVRRYQTDAFVARYAAVWAFGVVGEDRLSEPYYELLLDLATEVIGPDARVLDVGCGPGRIVASLSRRVPGAQVRGVDRSPLMIDLADAIVRSDPAAGVVLDASDFGFPPATVPGHGVTDAELACVDLDHLLAEERRYDLVVASHLLDRVPDPRSALSTLLRLVAPGGSLLISCAFNYEHRDQWLALPGAAEVVEVTVRCGFEVDWLDDEVPYREQLDARGTWTHHRVLVMRARRSGGGSVGGLRVP